MNKRENTLGYKILTNTGYKDFSGISFNVIQKVYNVTFDNGNSITATTDHELFVDWFASKPVSKLKVGEEVLGTEGFIKVVSIEEDGETEVYDVLEVDGVNRFYANDTLVHNCKFIGKSGTLVDSSTMRRLMEETRDKTYSFVVNEDIRFYKELDKHMKYLVAIDPSMGVSGDFAAIQVFEFPTFIQVAEWMSDNLNQNDQVEKLNTLITYTYKKLKELGCRSPEIYWTFENNTCGEGIIVALREKAQAKGYEYPQDYIRRGSLISQIGNKRLGFTTDKRTKNLGCSRLKIMIETHKIDILSKETVLELTNFTSNQVSYASSKADEHDDLVMAMVILINMYLQEKNKLDLMENINITKNPVESDSKYDMPFLFTMN